MQYISGWNDLAGALLVSVLNSFGIALSIAVLALVAVRYARSLNASTRYVIWWFVLLAVIAVPPVRTFVAARQHVQAESTLRNEPNLTVELPAVASAPAMSREQNEPDFGSLTLDPGFVPLAFLAAMVLLFIAQFVRVAWSYLHVLRIKARASAPCRELRLTFDEWLLGCRVDRPVRLLVSDDIPSPLAVGFRRPAVILPRSVVEHLSADDLDHMLLHELAHLARRDDWTNLLARVAWGALAWHPVAAWVLRRIDDEREIACDDWVVSMTGQARPYAVSLSNLVEFRLTRSREMLATGIGGRGSNLGDRIERLLQARCNFDARTSFTRVALTGFVLLTLVAVGTKAPQWVAFAQDIPAVPPEPPPPPSSPEPAVPPVPRTPRVVAQAAPATPPAIPPVPPAPPTRATNSSGSFLKALSEAGYTDLSVEEIISLRNSGVSPAYMAEMNQAGWGRLTVRQLTDLRNHNVTPALVKGLQAAGLGTFSMREMIDFANHGVSVRFVNDLKEAGLDKLSAADIVEARNQGVSGQDVSEAKKYGKDLPIRQMIRLKHAGVL